MKMAQALLLSGDLTGGWEHYEWRYQIPGATPLMPPTDRPAWDGRALRGERLLLIADQGYGDVLMFARYLSWASSRAASIVIACSQECEPTLRRMFPATPTCTMWEHLPDYACFCPFSGLPRLHGTILQTIPGGVPYCAADPALAAQWKARLDRDIPPRLRRVGIAWAGRPTHNNDHNRSVTLDAFAPLARWRGGPGVAAEGHAGGAGAAMAGTGQGRAQLLDLDPEIAASRTRRRSSPGWIWWCASIPRWRIWPGRWASRPGSCCLMHRTGGG